MRALIKIKKESADATLADLKKLGFVPESTGPLSDPGEGLYAVIGNVPIERWHDMAARAGVVDISADVRAPVPDLSKN